MQGRRFARGLVALLVGMALVATACGSDDGGTTAADASGTTTGAAAGAGARYDAFVKGTYTAPPKDGPKAASGKKVWIISCGQAVEGCAMFAGGLEEAAKAIGWDVTVFDGKLSPTIKDDGIRQAIAAKADAILLGSIQCSDHLAAIKQATDAGIAVVDVPDFGCGVDERDTIENPLTTWAPPSADDESFYDVMTEVGEGKALYLAENVPDAKIINVRHTLLAGTALDTGFQDTIGKCSGCSIVANVDVSDQDFVTGQLATKVSAALTSHPEANALTVPFDVVLIAGVAQAIARDGRKMTVLGGEGSNSGLNMIREGRVQATVAIPWEWAAWAGVDNLNRWFQKADRAPAGLGVQVVTATNGMPSEGKPFQTDVDFRAAYKAVWGV